MMPRRIVFAALVLVGFTCGLLPAQDTSSKPARGVQKQSFGTREGRPVNLYTLTNSHGVEVRAMNYGGIILSIRVPEQAGRGEEKQTPATPPQICIGAIDLSQDRVDCGPVRVEIAKHEKRPQRCPERVGPRIGKHRGAGEKSLRHIAGVDSRRECRSGSADG